MERTAMYIRAMITGILFVITAYWLLAVAGQISSVPTWDGQGHVLDTYQRAKDVLLVVLPLLTTALGYWFGAAGREHAEAKAAQAMTEVKRTQQKLEGVLSTSREQDLLSKAQTLYPDAFGLSRSHGAHAAAAP
ncbi:hypothetical protein [Knoellia sp. p5-6-4]|uniref:hypothetical protein n=1 Tax=unclassified Knoellia TaxID=2618719 RepID=UPI0023DA4CB3|nr:hypothetical protein [Knoellia sp. p5-6-4]MDF2145485.1 hypothetical protein [Knoellia sp. p5-6-4]